MSDSRSVNLPFEPVRIGCIGCGNISGQYLSMQQNFPAVQMVACADLEHSKAEAAAEKHGIPAVVTPDELLARDDIEIVLNLTVPGAHVKVAEAAIDAGKHCYMEKPLGINRAEGQRLVDKAKSAKLRVGCAPDTFMGAGLQTARKVIDEGLLGKVTAFTAFMISRGHEHWHPSPAFYYQPGGGPMFDMGPYYLTALLNLLGPIQSVAGMTSTAIPKREITSEPQRGAILIVQTEDHYCGTMQFTSGVVGSIIQSFAMRNAPPTPAFVIYGTDATLLVPDPNQFDDTVQIWQEGSKEIEVVPHAFPTGYGRAIGLADLAYAIRTNRPHRCSLEQAFTVLDAMQGFRDSSESGTFHQVVTGYQRPTPMPTDLPFGQLDG